MPLISDETNICVSLYFIPSNDIGNVKCDINSIVNKVFLSITTSF